ncbi:RNA pyrophosphohydrolase [Microvirga guangxiensis]|uniref:RNA pyrophosphohydrolase n=1 Tax=Microvirga guangxiensis TaxID=549386 RepID=A0A1G5B045_9HYPH|nr:RNA pyrophosphohydrolase [Microvirga guangxiensis]SCX83484.1 putative (di)nucleoside polyphosphate hydrolase [Microvirga guangxiensis]
MEPSTDAQYRPNVGIALFNGSGQVLIARRLGDDGPEIIAPGHEWQMPQGGIDEGEDPLTTAWRELWEETSVTNAVHLGETPDWLTYDFPPYDGPPHRLSRFRGQRQKWFAFRFTGEEREIDVTLAHEGAPQEFSEWRWAELAETPALVAPFKRKIYEHVAQAFRPFATPL